MSSYLARMAEAATGSGGGKHFKHDVMVKLKAKEKYKKPGITLANVVSEYQVDPGTVSRWVKEKKDNHLRNSVSSP